MNNTMRVNFFSIMWYKNLVKISKKLEKLVDLRVEEQFPIVWVGKRQNLLGEKKNTEL